MTDHPRFRNHAFALAAAATIIVAIGGAASIRALQSESGEGEWGPPETPPDLTVVEQLATAELQTLEYWLAAAVGELQCNSGSCNHEEDPQRILQGLAARCSRTGPDEMEDVYDQAGVDVPVSVAELVEACARLTSAVNEGADSTDAWTAAARSIRN